MTRPDNQICPVGDVDAQLRSLRWGAEITGNKEQIEQIDTLRQNLVAEPDDFVRRLLALAFPGVWADVDLSKLRFAFEFTDMCRKAVAAGMLPDDVRAHYPRKARPSTLGGVKDVAGAFALARGYRPRRGTTLAAAREWAMDALALGKRAGLPAPSLLLPPKP